MSLATVRRSWPQLTVVTNPSDLELAARRQYAAALKAIRVEKGLTQAEAALRAQVEVQSWQNYEAGRRLFKPDLILKVCQALGIEPEALEIKRHELSGPISGGEPHSFSPANVEGESEFARGPLSPTTRFRLLTDGPMGVEEVQQLIRQLELHNMALAGRRGNAA